VITRPPQSSRVRNQQGAWPFSLLPRPPHASEVSCMYVLALVLVPMCACMYVCMYLYVLVAIGYCWLLPITTRGYQLVIPLVIPAGS
jgi:hypothetical protein